MQSGLSVHMYPDPMFSPELILRILGGVAGVRELVLIVRQKGTRKKKDKKIANKITSANPQLYHK